MCTNIAAILVKSYKNDTITWFNIDILIACGKKIRVSSKKELFFFPKIKRRSWKHDVTKPFRCLCSQSIELKFQSKTFSLEKLKSINVLLFAFWFFFSSLNSLTPSFSMFAGVPLLCDVTTSFQNHNWIVDWCERARKKRESVAKEEISFFTFIEVKKKIHVYRRLYHFALYIFDFRGKNTTIINHNAIIEPHARLKNINIVVVYISFCSWNIWPNMWLIFLLYSVFAPIWPHNLHLTADTKKKFRTNPVRSIKILMFH